MNDPVVIVKVVKRLVGVYGAPNVPDPAALYAEYSKALTGYNPDYLEPAMDRIIRDHSYPGWPILGEIVAEVRRVAASHVKPPEHVVDPPAPAKEYVGPERAKALLSAFGKALTSNNGFDAIVARTPIGGQCDVDKPWGEEVTDRNGNIVPIRQRKGAA